jgi:hypothetical protein
MRPTAPTGVTALPGDGSASVSWTAPTFGAPISKYTAAVGSHACTTLSATNCVINGLKNGKTYKVKVTATNSFGTSPASHAAKVEPGLPLAPPGVTTVGGNGKVTVSWSPAADNGSPISNYNVVAAPGPRGCNASASDSCVVSGLTNGTSYTFTVSATNAEGTGAASPPSAPVTPAAVPGAPTGVTATAHNASASVSWTDPSSNGSAIESYTVTAIDSTTPGNGGQTVSGSGSPLTVASLTDGDSYTFTVTATNGVGTGPAGTSNAITPATVPDAPTGVSAAPDSNTDPGVLDVSFTPGFDEGSTIMGYTVTITDQTNPSDPNNGLTVSGSGSPITVSGLTSGDTYSFTVTATNGIGTSEPSSPSSGVVSP